MAKENTPSRDSGMAGRSLLEAILAIGIVGGAVALYMGQAGTGLQRSKAVNLRQDLVDGRESIRNRIDCDATLATYFPRPISAAKCAGAVAIIGRDGKTILPAGGGKVGDWRLVAECEDIPGQGLGLSFFATKPKFGGGFQQDPITKVPFDKNHPVSRIFPSWGRPCSEYFKGNPDNSCGPSEVATGATRSDGSVICSNAPTICTNMGGQWNSGECQFPLPEANCGAGENFVSVGPDGKAVCAAAASRLGLYRVKAMSVSKKAKACCKGSDKIIACTGAREENVNDTCAEEKCGYIGAVLQGNCCIAGADMDKGTEAVADAACAPAD